MHADSPLNSTHQVWRAFRAAAKLVLWLCPVLIVAACWEIITETGLMNERLLPPLSAVLAAWYDLLRSGQILPHLVVSLYRAIAGLAFGSAVGITIGILMARSRLVRSLIDPFVTLTFTLPKTAFIPIALLWLGIGDASSILVVFLGTLVPMTISTYHGARAVHNHLIWSARAMGSSRWRVLASVVFPASLPYIVNGLRIGLAFSIVVVISAEMVATDRGIGKFISLFGESGNYNYMFATILTIVSVTFAIDQAFVRFNRHLLRWADSNGRT